MDILHRQKYIKTSPEGNITLTSAGNERCGRIALVHRPVSRNAKTTPAPYLKASAPEIQPGQRANLIRERLQFDNTSDPELQPATSSGKFKKNHHG